MSSGHIPAEEAAEMHYSERPKCGYCGKFISADSSKYVWQTAGGLNKMENMNIKNLRSK